MLLPWMKTATPLIALLLTPVTASDLIFSLLKKPGALLTRSVAERLQAPDLFSGWGIRTLSSLSPAYNLMGYHLVTVWPHDNGIIASGLRALGFTDQALELAQGIFDLCTQQPYYRPPELFCGYERTPNASPVCYPVACSPQAWATGTIFQLLELMVNLQPDVPSNCLQKSPHAPTCF